MSQRARHGAQRLDTLGRAYSNDETRDAAHDDLTRSFRDADVPPRAGGGSARRAAPGVRLDTRTSAHAGRLAFQRFRRRPARERSFEVVTRGIRRIRRSCEYLNQ